MSGLALSSSMGSLADVTGTVITECSSPLGTGTVFSGYYSAFDMRRVQMTHNRVFSQGGCWHSYYWSNASFTDSVCRNASSTGPFSVAGSFLCASPHAPPARVPTPFLAQYRGAAPATARLRSQPPRLTRSYAPPTPSPRIPGNGSPNCTVVRSLFEDCSSPVYNGCGEIYHSAGLFLDSTFRRCRAQYAAGVFLLGGAPFPWCGTEPWCAGALLKMQRCVLEDNVATGLGGGGGMGVLQGGEAEISDTVFRNNSALGDEGGGLFWDNGQAPLVLRDTVFERNSASSCGGGASVRSASVVHLKNTSFVENSSGGSGGGLCVRGAAMLDRLSTCSSSPMLVQGNLGARGRAWLPARQPPPARWRLEAPALLTLRSPPHPCRHDQRGCAWVPHACGRPHLLVVRACAARVLRGAAGAIEYTDDFLFQPTNGLLHSPTSVNQRGRRRGL